MSGLLAGPLSSQPEPGSGPASHWHRHGHGDAGARARSAAATACGLVAEAGPGEPESTFRFHVVLSSLFLAPCQVTPTAGQGIILVTEVSHWQEVSAREAHLASFAATVT